MLSCRSPFRASSRLVFPSDTHIRTLVRARCLRISLPSNDARKVVVLTKEETDLSRQVFIDVGISLIRALAEGERFDFLDRVLQHLLGGEENAVSEWRERGDRPPSKVVILDFTNQNPSKEETLRMPVDMLLERYPDVGIVVCGDEVVHRILERIKNGVVFSALLLVCCVLRVF